MCEFEQKKWLKVPEKQWGTLLMTTDFKLTFSLITILVEYLDSHLDSSDILYL